MSKTTNIIPQSKLVVKRFVVGRELLFLVAVAPLFLFPGPWTAAGTAVIVLLWLARLVAKGRLTVPTPMDGAALLLVLTAMLGLYVSVDLAQSMPRFWMILLGLALFYGLANGLPTRSAARLAGDLFVAGGVGLALLTIIGTDWLSNRMVGLPIYEHLPALVRDPAGAELFNPRVMGMALAVALPVPLSLALFGSGVWRRVLSAMTALVMGTVLILTQSLQGVLGLAAALLALLVWRSRWFLLLIPLGLGLVGAAVLVYGPQQLAIDLLSVDHPLGVGVVLRLDIWSRAWAMIRDLPYTGIGLGSFAFVQSNFYPGFLVGPEPHTHSLYLELVTDLGVPGLLAMLWLLLAFARTVVRARPQITDRNLRSLVMGSSAGVVAYLAAGLIDAPWAGKPGVLLWVLLGTGVAVSRMDDGQAGSITWRRFLPAAGLVALVALCLLLLPGSRALNLGSVSAHQALTKAQTAGSGGEAELARAAAYLEQAVQSQPNHRQALRTLGRLYGWLGESERGLEALERAVSLDGEAPMARYGPWLPWLRELTGAKPVDPWDDLLWVYRNWNNRYPQRAEGYVLRALVLERHKGDPAGAQRVLTSGVEKGAKPEGLLSHYLSQFE